MSATKIRRESGCLIFLVFNLNSRVLSNSRRLFPSSGRVLRQPLVPGLLQTSTSLIPTQSPFHLCPELGTPGFQNTGVFRIGYLCTTGTAARMNNATSSLYHRCPSTYPACRVLRLNECVRSRSDC